MKIKVDNYSVYPSRFIVGTKGSLGIEYMDLCFSREWERMDKSIVFRTPSGKRECVALRGEPVMIPDCVMSESGVSSFAVVGSQNGRTRTTLSGELHVLDTIDTDKEDENEH
jgi:hypothetical protein